MNDTDREIVKDIVKNLKIKVETKYEGDYYGGGTYYIIAKLFLDEELINEDKSDGIYVKDN